MNSLQWLNDLAQWLGRVFPRLTLVPPTHSGVMFGPKGGTSLKGSGIVFWWPMLQTLEQVDISIGSMDVASVSMPINWDREIPRVAFVGTVVRWRVRDPCLVARCSLDIKRLIDNTSQAAVGKHWNGIDSADEAIEKAFKDVTKDLMDIFGIQILSLKRSHLGSGVGIFQITDWTNTSSNLEV